MTAPFATYRHGEPARVYVCGLWQEITAREAAQMMEVLARYVRDEITRHTPRGAFTARRSGGTPMAAPRDGADAGVDG